MRIVIQRVKNASVDIDGRRHSEIGCGLMILLPLIVMYLFAQKYIVQGIERSGITG